MNTPVKWLARALAGALAFLLVFTLPLSLLAYDIWETAFNAPRIKRLLTDEVVNRDLLPAILEALSGFRAQQRLPHALTGQNTADIGLLMSFLDRDDWKQIRAEALPPETAATWVATTVDGAYAWLDSADRVPAFMWELSNYKAHLQATPGDNITLIAYEQLPTCTETQLADFAERRTAEAGAALYDLCQFPAPWRADQFAAYASILRLGVDALPAQLELTRDLAAMPDPALGFNPHWLKAQVRLAREIGRWLWLSPLVSVGLIVLLAVRSGRQLRRWVGLPLLGGGVVALIPALIYPIVITNLFNAGVLGAISPLVLPEIMRASLRLGAVIFQPLLIQAGVCLVVSVGLFIWPRLRFGMVKSST